MIHESHTAVDRLYTCQSFQHTCMSTIIVHGSHTCTALHHTVTAHILYGTHRHTCYLFIFYIYTYITVEIHISHLLHTHIYIHIYDTDLFALIFGTVYMDSLLCGSILHTTHRLQLHMCGLDVGTLQSTLCTVLECV